MIFIFNIEVGIPHKYAANNVTALRSLIQAVDAIKAHDGGDCLELGMTGILNALSLASPDSNVVVLTDAGPKDVEKMDEVLEKAIKLRNSIHFFLSDTCGDYSLYLDIADKTHGVVVHQINDFEAFAEFANKVGTFKTGGLRDLRKRQTIENCAEISTSVFTESIDILFSSISIGSVISITNPLGTVQKITPPSGRNTAAYSTSPIAGIYKICSSGTFEYSFSIPSNLDFFVEYVDDNISSASLPSPGNIAIIFALRCHLHLYVVCRYFSQDYNFLFKNQ